MRTRLFLLFVFFVVLNTKAQTLFDTTGQSAKLQWFAQAKLGIFIHYGIYAVNGIDESWAFYNLKISWEDYMKQLDGFTASAYQPDRWAELFDEAGAKYAILTTKHHDGVALWPTAAHTYNTLENTPAKRDLVEPFCQSIRAKGIKVGLYFSLIDWSHNDYPAWTKTKNRYNVSEDTARWLRFQSYCQAQINEISQRYNPDIFWFDGDWEHTAAEWQAPNIRRNILTTNPKAIINSRLQGYGDYATPEQFLPITRPENTPWELCLTTNDQWGYQPRDTNYKTPNQVIRIFADCIGNGGNLLLDVGPKPDGTIPTEQANILKGLGRWTHKHAEAIYNTQAGLPLGYFYGPSTLSDDRKTLYLYMTERPNGPIQVKGLVSKVNKIRVVGTNQTLTSRIMMKLSWSTTPGILYINVPVTVLDPDLTVIALELDSPCQVHK